MAKKKVGTQIGSLIPKHKKLGIDPISLRATCHWKALHEGYNIALDRILIGGLHTKL
jgi:hypothetical protein